MASEHRKIELQSPADLTYISTNIQTLATQKLDLHLPPDPSAPSGAPDDLRTQVDTLVSSFISDVLSGVRSNISINGIDIPADGEAASKGEMSIEDATREDFEPLDEKLRVRLVELHARRDGLVGQISKHRRVTPGVASARWREQFVKESAVWEEQQRGAQAADVDEEGVKVEVKRAEDVSRAWERSVQGLAGLNKGLGETRARLERCGDVVGYMEGSSASK